MNHHPQCSCETCEAGRKAHGTEDEKILKAARVNGERPAGSGPCGVEPGDNYNSPKTLIARGLTKREMLAAMILQGLTAGRNHDWGSNFCAEEAVRLADELLKELAK